jgi:hypothetical protein
MMSAEYHSLINSLGKEKKIEKNIRHMEKEKKRPLAQLFDSNVQRLRRLSVFRSEARASTSLLLAKQRQQIPGL